MLKLKSDTDIEGIRGASHILVDVLDVVEKNCIPGIPTIELDRIAQKEIKNAGVSPSFLGYQGFPNALCTSINEEVIHGIPKNRSLKEGDVIGIDCGIRMGNYFTDAARTIPIGIVSAEQRRLLTTAKKALEFGIQAGSEGKKILNISEAIYEHVTEAGFGTVRMFSGHGLGFSVHEEPAVPNYVSSQGRVRLREGLVIAIEPMVCMGNGDVYIANDHWTVLTTDGKAAAHFEHTVAYYDGMLHILTEK